uniref:Disease resistance protein At4g11170 family n=1 Tax=Cajanus cajan TaxID=3821 RepID=A0A151RJR6_CAJCA|nr:Putative disease resistance protein At4g11170 family [Cajanus cajan]
MHGFKLQAATAIAAARLWFGRSSQPQRARNCYRICSQFSTNSIIATQEQPRPQSTVYDVFVSFRGKDIRQGFLGHLVEAFPRKQIHAFVDYKLERGDEISPSLLQAIEGSSISLVIFSKDYASSRWCLEELVKIVECREIFGQAVIPVFYHVDPTDVRHQKGSYENALVELEKYSDSTRLEIWRLALKKSANLSGIRASDFRDEADLLEEIVKTVDLQLIRMGKHPVNSKGLIGIDKTIADIELLCQESKDVRVIGIWGMGGIGKTTIAAEVYNKICSKYEDCFFLPNVREESERHGIISLKEKLFSKLLAEDVKINTPNGLTNYIERRISRKKVLIVLDDLNDSDQLEKIIGSPDQFGLGSRVIVTTRDKQVLISNNVDGIYKVKVLNRNDALDLFKLKAFNQNHLEKEYYVLAEKVVDYAKGVPLVLKVLAHLLRGKDKTIWESQLDKLRRIPCKKVHDVMRLSYDDLDREEQKILLDLACFFTEVNLEVQFVKRLLKDQESDNSVAIVLEALKDKALISINDRIYATEYSLHILLKDHIDISVHNVISIHNIIQEMAWEIARHESRNDHGHCSRLWAPDDICYVLKNNKGTEAIRSITTKLSTLKNLKLSPFVFAKMSKLQFLDFHADSYVIYPNENSDAYLDLLPHGLESLPNELRYLRWHCYPLKSLPEQFSAEKLVILDLACSRVEKIWNGVKNLVNLKEVKLRNCNFLQELPDFSKAKNLEELEISYCSQLTSVHESIFSLDKLQKLQIVTCTSLTRLSSHTHLSSLRDLQLRFCESLRTCINALPTSFGRQSKLEILVIEGIAIESLPSSIKNLTRLKYLDARSCSELQILPELPTSLDIMYACNCRSLKTVLFPSAVEQLKENRKSFLLNNCMELDEQSLMAIGLNAQINLMKFAYQHLPFLKNDHIENYGDYDNNYVLYQAVYVYPGTSIPDWLEYKTTTEEDYIIIDLSSVPSPPLAFIFCFIIHTEDIYLPDETLKLKITISDDENEDNKDSIEIYTFLPNRLQSASKHLFVVYDQRCSCYLNSKAKSLPKFKIGVVLWGCISVFSDRFKSFNKKGTRRSLEALLPKWRRELKGFGVSPIHASAYHNFVQQMELL